MATAPLIYDGLSKKALQDYKFNDRSYYYKMWGEILSNHLQMKCKSMLKEIDLIVSIPLTHKKKVIRGFNQTELIAQYISEKVDIPYRKTALIKNKMTLDQNQLNRLDRSKNSKNSFEVDKKGYYLNRKILLIDDILTTGNTVEEGSRILLEAGALEVYVATIATGCNV